MKPFLVTQHRLKRTFLTFSRRTAVNGKFYNCYANYLEQLDAISLQEINHAQLNLSTFFYISRNNNYRANFLYVK